MRSFEERVNERPKARSRQIILEKLSKRFPDRAFDSDDVFYDTLVEYDSHLCDRYEKLRDDQTKLATLFISNPKMGGFISDVIGGEDALVACVRYFGKDVLECANDENRMAQLRKENDEFLARMSKNRAVEKEMAENWEHSKRAISRFKESKGMNDDDFDNFLDKVHHICEHVFMSDFTPDVLEILFKGINYDNDLGCAEKAAEVRGRNERILLEKKQTEGDSLPGLQNNRSVKEESENLTPGFGLRRRRSVWDM
ncbi:hypothetical protein [Coprobacter sp.]